MYFDSCHTSYILGLAFGLPGEIALLSLLLWLYVVFVIQTLMVKQTTFSVACNTSIVVARRDCIGRSPWCGHPVMLSLLSSLSKLTLDSLWDYVVDCNIRYIRHFCDWERSRSPFGYKELRLVQGNNICVSCYDF